MSSKEKNQRQLYLCIVGKGDIPLFEMHILGGSRKVRAGPPAARAAKRPPRSRRAVR